MSKGKRKRVDVNLNELDQLLDQAQQAPLSEPDCKKIKTTLHMLVEMLVAKRGSEKTRAVVDPAASQAKPEAKPKVNGHGRTPASAYTGARKVSVPHPDLQHGQACPECPKGKVYAQKEPRPVVRIIGQAPLAATVYEMEQLRCNACGQLFTAPEPEGIGPEKYDETAAAMVAQLKYGSGMPFNRIENLEKLLGVPLPAATQWEIVEEAAVLLQPAQEELIREAAQGELFHNDDTSVRILKLKRPEGDQRTGVFTSGVVSVVREASGVERQIAMYFSGREHAGENLGQLLQRRAAELGPAILMPDALSRNVPKLNAGVELLLANCMAHGRRQFVEVAGSFPSECRHVLEKLGEVYGNDEAAKEQGLSPPERLRFHQERSAPIMEGLHGWLSGQLSQHQVEPNSGLGKAMNYLLRHWQPLTLFLRQAGAPLDNNVCERALKRAVLHRKNALFYKTMNGAETGDLFMSLIHTCELCDANPFDYLTELQRHAAELAQSPSQWMPWNYREMLGLAAAGG